MAWLRRLCAALAVASAGLATALPWEQPPHDDYSLNGSHPFADFPPVVKARQNDNDKTELRILPLGASIMSGVGASNDGAGLRKWVRMALRHDEWPVNMVGSRNTGRDMTDNDHEATSGAILTEIRDYLDRSLGYKPNIVMINGGTNNANRGDAVDLAYDQMNDILQAIWGHDEAMKHTCIILSTLLPTTEKLGRINRIPMNNDYRRLVDDHKGERCIYLADMEPTGEGSDYLSVDGPYWSDPTHPNDEGHKRMAYVFYAAIHRALAQVKPAAPMDEEPRTECDKEYGDGIYAGGLTQKGWGHHDGTYKHSSKNNGVILEIKSDWDRDQWRFARLFDSQYSDLVGWFEKDDDDHRFGVWKNSADGLGEFTKIDDMLPKHYCNPPGLHFIDMNADGLDDLVCIHPNGDLYLSTNNGDGSGSKPPSWKWHGKIASTGAKQDRIKLADIDGDGRGDYGVVGDNEEISFWRNGWVDDKPKYWQPLGVRATMKPGVSLEPFLEGLRFVDLNGDGRDDWMYMKRTGQTTVYTNTRSCMKGKEGDGLNVAWRKARNEGSDKYTHYGMIDFLTRDDRNAIDQVHFGQVYGRRTAFGNLFVKDYVFFEMEENGKGEDLKYTYKLHAWENTGAGGTKLIADGNKYCNMMGHEGGHMDYVWTWSWGKMHIFPNAEKITIKDPESYWGPETVMWTPPDGNMHRRDLHLADWNDDGVCDIIYSDPDTGAVRVFINEYVDKTTWDGAFREVSVDGLSCEHRSGIGLHDLSVRFADITGNGRADYLCIAPNGKVVGNLHEDDDSFSKTMQIKFSDTMDRANLRWEDVDGDGKADMIWINKFNGDGHVWYNKGRADPEKMGGSHFHWKPAGKRFQGSQAGSCMYFPDLDGDGRADMHGVKGTWTNEAETWYNPPCGLSDVTGDDPDSTDDPGFDPQPNNPIGGPGPGEDGNETPGTNPEHPDDCKNLDKRKWREIGCNTDAIEDPTWGTAKSRWESVDADGAWLSSLEWVNCREKAGQDPDSFTNVALGNAAADKVLAKISDFLNGPNNMRCEVWEAKGTNCDGGEKCQENERAAGSFIIDSFATIHSINWNLGQAVDDGLSYINSSSLAKSFGLVKEDAMNPSLNVVLDIFAIVFAVTAGVHWNFNFMGKENAGDGPFDHLGAIKDISNDMVAQGITLGKDAYADANPATDEGQLKDDVYAAIQGIAEAWRSAVAQTNSWLFGGSAKAQTALTYLMAEGKMSEGVIDGSNVRTTQQVKRAMAAMMIPQIWRMSPDHLFPVIIREELGCDSSPELPWTSSSMRWMTSGAYDERICGDETGGASVWLLTPENYSENCASNGGDDPKCSPFDLPPGFDVLKDRTLNISHLDIVRGSLATWEKNDRKNGMPLPEVNHDLLNQLLEDDIATPGVYNIPVCTLSEARHNWYEAYISGSPLIRDPVTPWPGFPCDKEDD